MNNESLKKKSLPEFFLLLKKCDTSTLLISSIDMDEFQNLTVPSA